MSILDEYHQAMELVSPSISKYMRPVLREKVPHQSLYHISTNHKIPVFVPMVSKRTVEKEDNSMPRICVASDILSCTRGYGALFGDYYGNEELAKKGWAIYDFDFELAVRPTVKLLPDQKETGEYWLITYSKETREYQPKVIGTFNLVTYRAFRTGKTHCTSLGFVVDAEQPLWFTPELELSAGKHWVAIEGWRFESESCVDDMKASSREIDAKTFKQLLAGELNFLDQVTPASANW